MIHDIIVTSNGLAIHPDIDYVASVDGMEEDTKYVAYGFDPNIAVKRLIEQLEEIDE